MTKATKPVFALTAADLMRHEVIAIPKHISLRAAAQLLFDHQIGGAPVVDTEGRCVGMLCATDVAHWAADGAPSPDAVSNPTCPFRQKGRALTGEQAAICTLAEGSCALQVMQPSTGGRHIAVCPLPDGVLPDWLRMIKNLPGSVVQRYMTTDVVTANPQTSLGELAEMMVDAHIDRIVVVDSEHKPVGIVSSMDVVAALATADERS